MKLMPLALLLGGGLILTAGDLVMKQWVNTDKKPFFFLGLLIYLAGLVFLAYSFRYKNIAVASVIFVVGNVITLAAVSWLYFKEPLSVGQLIGISLGIASVAVLELAG